MSNKDFIVVEKCPSGKVLRKGTYVEPFTRKDSVKIKGFYRAPVCVKDLGLPGKGKTLIGPLVKGSLGEFGYKNVKDLSVSQRHSSLNKFVKHHAKRATKENAVLSAYRKLIAVSTLNKNTNPKFSAIARQDADWLKKQI